VHVSTHLFYVILFRTAIRNSNCCRPTVYTSIRHWRRRRSADNEI